MNGGGGGFRGQLLHLSERTTGQPPAPPFLVGLIFTSAHLPPRTVAPPHLARTPTHVRDPTRSLPQVQPTWRRTRHRRARGRRGSPPHYTASTCALMVPPIPTVRQPNISQMLQLASECGVRRRSAMLVRVLVRVLVYVRLAGCSCAARQRVCVCAPAPV